MKYGCLLLLAGLFLGCQSQDGSMERMTKLETQQDRVSYAIGLNVGTNMLRDSVRFLILPLLQGLKDAALDSTQRLMTQAEVEQTLTTYQQELQMQAMERMRKQGEERLKAGKEYLEKNKSKPGVMVLPSGLQYKVVKQGNGPKPTSEDFLTAHYRGTLVSGEEFDSSYKVGEPSTFRIANVIRGWQQALLMMPVGSKWELFVPSELGYGESGSGPIGPNEVLLFEIELLKVENMAGKQ